MRLDHGHWLLCNTSRRITDIALECGFYDSTHFSRSYRKVYLETPKATRLRTHATIAASSG